MDKNILKKLHDGLGALAFFPPTKVANEWGQKEAKKQGKQFMDYVNELKKKHSEYRGFLPLETEYAESKGFNLEDYWQARLNGATEIKTVADIQKWLKR